MYYLRRLFYMLLVVIGVSMLMFALVGPSRRPHRVGLGSERHQGRHREDAP